MSRYIPIAGLLALFACDAAPALAQGPQPIPINAYCVKMDQAGVFVGTPEPKRLPLFVDDDGDSWMVLKNEATGVTVVGFESPANGIFCATGIKGGRRGPPQRGA